MDQLQQRIYTLSASKWSQKFASGRSLEKLYGLCSLQKEKQSHHIFQKNCLEITRSFYSSKAEWGKIQTHHSWRQVIRSGHCWPQALPHQISSALTSSTDASLILLVGQSLWIISSSLWPRMRLHQSRIISDVLLFLNFSFNSGRPDDGLGVAYSTVETVGLGLSLGKSVKVFCSPGSDLGVRPFLTLFILSGTSCQNRT